MDEKGRIVGSAALAVEEAIVETSLRPRVLEEYIGQEKVKANLRILLEAARQRGEAADHILLYGPPAWARRRSPTSSPASSVSPSTRPPDRPSSAPATWPRS